MRNKLAILKNVVNLRSAFEALATRDAGVPGMGLVHGFTGYGKTTTVAWLVTQVNGVFVRAGAMWTPNAMLGAIMAEIGAAAMWRNQSMVNHIVATLAQTNRPLFVDEADYCLRNPVMLETLRDMHDLAGVPVVLIGMEGFERKLVHRLQLARRISQWVEFLPADVGDARTLTDTVCEIEVGDDLLARLHEETKGNVGLMIVALSRIEAMAKANSWRKVDADRWGNRRLTVAQPKVRSAA